MGAFKAEVEAVAGLASANDRLPGVRWTRQVGKVGPVIDA